MCCQVQVKAPLYVVRQWYKHHVASNFTDEQDGWNELSMRYTDVSDAEFYVPQIFRQQSKDNKQGSGEPYSKDVNYALRNDYRSVVLECLRLYADYVGMGASKEQLRGVLPTCIYTRFRWTTSLESLLNFLTLRKDNGAQSEIALYAEAIEELVKPYFPNVFTAWLES